MPHYMIQAAYTPEALQALVKTPQNRTETVRAAVEHMGGKMVGNWACFGDYDTIVVVEMSSTWKPLRSLSPSRHAEAAKRLRPRRC